MVVARDLVDLAALTAPATCLWHPSCENNELCVAPEP